jgi:hypothetical protein
VKKLRCKNTEHDDQVLRGRRRRRCRRCGDVFPCRNECEHVDCILESERELPEWISVRDGAAKLDDELAGAL